jgi:hypothetical protein
VISAPSPSPSPFEQPPAPGGHVFELVIAVLLALVGLWSLARWVRTEFVAGSVGERALYVLHVTARVGLWFGFAAFFLGLALVDEPAGFTWFLIVPLALAGLQLVTAVALRQGAPRRGSESPPPGDHPVR